ncbi:MAG: GNAT family N-acetyltransferase [Acidobacteriia bacterium]|nr:GNAT family N-acetyltransferase [Terriglobia bacterium]
MISIRDANANDAVAIARLVNTAFLVEQFFIERDRTNPEVVRGMMKKGKFLLAEDEHSLVGSIYVELRGERGYFGMLSIEPSRQGMGVGHRLVDAAENYFLDAGCMWSDLIIVNVRTELLALYGRWGYKETGTAPYDDPHPTKIPVHFILMSKPLS